ncbi:MAG: cell division protein ZapA [Gemmatimonadota bacterium]|nr:cell division protein ZapA [Gemmatimonadota bacterium]MDH5759525.1 cell division protein ZapA [Gemmatimonadota bacterium]
MSADVQKSSVTVRIAGEDHTIRANVAPEYTRQCARVVDDRIHEIRSKSGLIEGHKAAILAALSIVDELFQAREEMERFQAESATRMAKLAKRIEEALPPSGQG